VTPTDRWNNRIIGAGTEDPRTLVPNDRNWRTHPRRQRSALRTSMEGVGWIQAVTVNRRTGKVLDGHLRLEEAIAHGERSVPVQYVDLSPQEEMLALASLDPISAMAEADRDALAGLLQGIDGKDDAVRELLAAVADSYGVSAFMSAVGASEPDDVPDLTNQAVTRLGERWALGEHVVLCGDARDQQMVEAQFARERAACLLTDPPYGVDYEGRTARRLRIANDRPGELRQLLTDAFTAADAVLVSGAPVYVCSPPGPQLVTFASAFGEHGWTLHQPLVWAKDAFVLGHSDYHYRHELVWYGWKGGRHPWYGGRDRSSVLEFPRPQRSASHPTIKPVALFEAFLTNSTARGALVYDPFVGSGTSIVAAERLGRRCVGVDIDPGYVDVAVRRWQGYTGKVAILSDDGRSFDELEEVRRGG
jgi:DNA modification methylase